MPPVIEEPRKSQRVDQNVMSNDKCRSSRRGDPAAGGRARARARKEDWIANQLRRVYDDALNEAIPQSMLDLLNALDENQTKPKLGAEDRSPVSGIVQAATRRGDPDAARLRPLAVGQPRPRGRPGAGDAGQGDRQPRQVPDGNQPARLAGDHPAQPVLFRGPPPLAGGLGRRGHPRRAPRRAAGACGAGSSSASSWQRCRSCPTTSARRWSSSAPAASPTRRPREVLGTRVGTVKSRVSRARSRLEEMMAGQEGFDRDDDAVARSAARLRQALSA